MLLPGRASAGAAEEGDSIFQRSAADVRAEVLAAQRRREQDSVSTALHPLGCLVSGVYTCWHVAESTALCALADTLL